MGENYFLTDILYSIKLEDVDDERTVSTAQELISLLQAAWNEKFDDFSDILAVCSQQMRRARAELPQWETDASYAVGRLAGALEIYISLYQADQEIKRIDSILQKELKNSRQTTKKILEDLYEAPAPSGTPFPPPALLSASPPEWFPAAVWRWSSGPPNHPAGCQCVGGCLGHHCPATPGN